MNWCRVVRGSAVAVLALGAAIAAPADLPERDQHLADFDAFCRFVEERYAYFDVKKVDWPRVCVTYRPRAADAKGRDAFVNVVERALAELYDPHAHLGTSNAASWRLVPTDSDLFAEWRDGRATIVEVRRESAAAAVGLRSGMTVVAIDGQDVGAAVGAIMPTTLVADDPAARDWALGVALAGHQDRRPVRVLVDDAAGTRSFAFVPGIQRPAQLASASRVGGVGVITVHNSLGEPRLVAKVDQALAQIGDGSALVLDLRDTPSGGNTRVARGVMSRLVDHEAPYQRHEDVSEMRESGVRHVWMELIEPRGSTFRGPVVVLVGRWTGSMGEGVAIGLQAARDARVVGQPMAGLRGALAELRLPHAGFVVRIPAEKLFGVDGRPREAFMPQPLPPSPSTDAADADDELLSAARIAAALRL